MGKQNTAPRSTKNSKSRGLLAQQFASLCNEPFSSLDLLLVFAQIAPLQSSLSVLKRCRSFGQECFNVLGGSGRAWSSGGRRWFSGGCGSSWWLGSGGRGRRLGGGCRRSRCPIGWGLAQLHAFYRSGAATCAGCVALECDVRQAKQSFRGLIQVRTHRNALI